MTKEGMLEKLVLKPSDGNGDELSRHAGIPTISEFKRLSDIKNRNVNTFMSPQDVRKSIYEPAVHPYKRTMIGINTDAFETAVDELTDAIKKAKNDKKGVFHLQCCNIVWIGRKPRVHSHVMNDLFRKLFDVRNVPKALYDPSYLPPNPYELIYTDHVYEKEPQKLYSTEQLIEIDKVWKNIFGPAYIPQINESSSDRIVNELNHQVWESLEINHTDLVPIRERDSCETSLEKKIRIEPIELTKALDFFSRGAEIGEGCLIKKNKNGTQELVSEDETDVDMESDEMMIDSDLISQ